MARSSWPTVIAVLSAHDQDRLIGSILLKLRRFVDRVIVVNNGSRDRTAAIAEQAGAEVVDQELRLASSAALERGLARALDLGADVVVILEGEAQLIPEQVPLVTEPILQDGVDVVLGVPLEERTGGRPRLGRWAGVLAAYTRTALATFGLRGVAGHEGLTAVPVPGLRTLEVPISPFHSQSRLNAEPKRSPAPATGTPEGTRPLAWVPRVPLLLLLALSGLLLTGAGIYLWYQTVRIFDRTSELALGHAVLATLCITVGVMVTFEAITLHILKRLTTRPPLDAQTSETAGEDDPMQ